MTGEVSWASQQEATKVEDDEGNNGIKRERSQPEFSKRRSLLSYSTESDLFHTVSYMSSDGLLMTKATRWVLIIIGLCVDDQTHHFVE
jgi:hypothetical protein